MALRCDSRVILWGERRCQSIKENKGLRGEVQQRFPVDLYAKCSVFVLRNLLQLRRGLREEGKHTGEQSDISFSHLFIYIAVTAMISDSYGNKALVQVLIRCVKLYFQCKRCLFSNGVFWMKIILIIIVFLSLKRTLPNPEYKQLRNYQFLSSLQILGCFKLY